MNRRRDVYKGFMLKRGTGKIRASGDALLLLQQAINRKDIN